MHKAILVIIILFIIFVKWSYVHYDKVVKQRMKAMDEKSNPLKGTVEEMDIGEVPEIVWKYFKMSRLFGKRKINRVTIEYKGHFKNREEDPWKKFESVQHYTMKPYAYIWNRTFYFMKFPIAKIYEEFGNSLGTIYYKFFCLFKNFEYSGRVVNEAAVLKYLSDMLWYPTAFADPDVTWEAVDKNAARAIITKGNIKRSGIFYFNEKGYPTNFVSNRYKYRGRTKGTYEWSVPTKGHVEYDGFVVPRYGRVVWHLPEGDFCYMEFEVTNIKYEY